MTRLRLFAPVDIASLVALRIAFGTLMILAVARYFAHGWIPQLFLEPRFFFTYPGFEWVRPWPGVGMYVHFAVLGVLAAFVAAGLWYRLSIALFCAGFTYAHLVDKTNYLNHYYLISLLSLLMVFLPLHRAASLDAWRRPALRRDTVPAWALWTVRLQIALVYLFGGVAKLNADWLLAAQPLKLWLAASADLPLVGALLGGAWVAYLFSWAGALFDLTIAFFLLAPRMRGWAYVAVVVFHVLTAALFPIGVFPWVMIAVTPVFFAPDWPRRLLARVRGGAGRTVAAVVPEVGAPRAPARRAVCVALALYFAVQAIVPLRSLLYPGNSYWTEEGFRFAWKVMVMEKSGLVTFTVGDPASGRGWTVDPRDTLTPLQARMMATQPDMILDFAHWIARTRGGGDVEVRADAYASLNGRPHQRLVDPTVDLARERASVRAWRWVLPLTDDRRLATHPERAPRS